MSYPQRETGLRSTFAPTSSERPSATLTLGLPGLITSGARRDQRRRAHLLSGCGEDMRPAPMTPHLLDARNPNHSPVLLVRSGLTPAYQPRQALASASAASEASPLAVAVTVTAATPQAVRRPVTQALGGGAGRRLNTLVRARQATTANYYRALAYILLNYNRRLRWSSTTLTNLSPVT